MRLSSHIASPVTGLVHVTAPAIDEALTQIWARRVAIITILRLARTLGWTQRGALWCIPMGRMLVG
jgi:hypothetical protein